MRIPRKKGTPKTGGRVKGVPNKVTASLRDAILHAFDKVGGVDYLELVARTHPPIFCMLLARVLPLQVNGTISNPDGSNVENRTVIVLPSNGRD